MKRDPALDALLDLDGSILDQGNGFWVKIDVKLVVVSPAIPHGIRYSLTLHDKYGKRILGYDNAHAPHRPKKLKFAGRIRAYDHLHRHPKDQGVPYEFKDAQQLINDFFNEVDRVLEQVTLK